MPIEVTHCPACNAIVLLEDKVVTDRCPYCSTLTWRTCRFCVAETDDDPAGGRAAVQGGQPRSHRKPSRAWLGKPVVSPPNALRKLANLGQLNGIYVPFWTFDSMTYTHYTGLRGDNYWETETYTETNAQGQTETKTRQVMRTLWTPVAGEVRHFFDDVLICASKGLPEEYRTKVMPRELKGLEEFKPDFLSGFKTEQLTRLARATVSTGRAISWISRSGNSAARTSAAISSSCNRFRPGTSASPSSTSCCRCGWRATATRSERIASSSTAVPARSWATGRTAG